jgi:hypothetical protein
VAKKKVVSTNLDQNLNGTNFNNIASETIFQFGSFGVTSNFEGRRFIDYSNALSSFVRPVTLETMGVNDTQSAVLHQYQINATLNLDKSNLNTYVKFGSTYEFFRVSTQEIILNYPGSLFANSNINPAGNITAYDIVYNSITDITTFKVPSTYIVNKFGLIFNQGNTSEPDNNVLKNVNLSYAQYSIWSKYDPNKLYPVIEFTGDTPNTLIPHVTVKVIGNPFTFNTGITGNLLPSGSFDFHIRPNNVVFEEFRALLTNYEQYIVSQRDGNNGFTFNVSDPTLLDDGSVVYSTVTLLWTTSDCYNIDTDNASYQRFLSGLLTTGTKYDLVKTDLIARFLTPTSLKTYDLTEDGKMTKLLRVYGWEFDQLKKFIDSLVNINTVTYNKLNNIPDQLVSNLAKTFGWNYFTLVNEGELVQNFLSVDNTERNLNTDLLPAEINIELWRRILINTNYFWKSKGTRQAIKAMFLLIGIPEPFINITEYVYTVNGKINPNTVPFTAADFPTNSLPYDNSGYPVAPVESNYFYFQVSGDTDSGQAYMDVFRKAGFSLVQTVDNKKSWIQTGATTRIDDTTPQYFQYDSKLVLNTKEVDVALDTARGIEYDVYDYILKDFAANSSGYTLPYSYVNISLGVGLSANTFTIPDKTQGDFEVRFNGILLNAPKTGTTTGITYQADYTINYNTNTFTLTGGNYAVNSGNRRDVVQATYIYSGNTHPVTGITVDYIVTRVKAQLPYTYIPLPSYPRGDVQITINGIALTKGTPQFVADYILDPANSISGSNQIILQNPAVISYLAGNPEVQIAYVKVAGSNEINARSEVLRVDSFNSSKIYFNISANKYVYSMNYKANDAKEVKVLIDGIALEPYTDYQINPLNSYEIFLPKGIKYGSVISVYYLVALSSFFAPIVANSFGVGDISKLSFLEFIELIQRRLINAKTRKTISDFKGGWYPSLLNVYIQYLIRGLLPENDPLHSNGYTFENLYPFLSKYNSFFQYFVDELLPATIIQRQGGILVRNTVFTKQKFMYKRGVNLYSGGSTTLDMRGLPMVQYLGDDGSTFLINQELQAPPPPVIPTLYVCTTPGTPGIGSITDFGGNSISISTGLNTITSYGVQYRRLQTDPWLCVNELGAPTVNHYSMSVSSLLENTRYMYQAYILSGSYFALGQIFSGTTLSTPVIPGLKTKLGTAGTYTIDSGGIAITGGSSAQWYGMQYRLIGTIPTDFNVSPTTLHFSSAASSQNVRVTGDTSNSFYIVSDADVWVTSSPANFVLTPPSPTGVVTSLIVTANYGSARSMVVDYVPTTGPTKYVTVNQDAGVSPYKTVSFLCCTGGHCDELDVLSCGTMAAQPAMSPGETYTASFTWSMRKPDTPYAPQRLCVELTCNGNIIGNCSVSAKLPKNCVGSWGPFTAHYGDVFDAKACATAETTDGMSSSANVAINNIVSGVGLFIKGEYPYMQSVYAQTCSTTILPPV